MVNINILGSLTSLNPSSLKALSSKIGVLLEQKLWAKILLGMILGVLFGLVISPVGIFQAELVPYKEKITSLVSWLNLPASFFLKTVKMVIIPLILASIVRGLASTDDASQMKSLGKRFGLFVLVTSSLGSLVGIAVTSLLKPGQFLNLEIPKQQAAVQSSSSSMFSFSSISPEFFLNVLPSNPLSSIVEGQMLDVVIISLIGGIALLSIDAKQGKIVLDLLEVIQNICMTIITWAMKLAPYAVFGMMAQVAAMTGLRALKSMGLYVLAAYAGFILFLLLYVLAALIIKKVSPFNYLKKISTALLLAFSTSSSAATMPMTLKVAEENLNVPNSLASFLIPLGTTINMAGATIWHTTAVIFLGQVYNIDLSAGQIAFVVATSIGSAIGSPGVPGVGMGILATVLSRVGIPIEGISLIIGVDRLVDMGCTVVNVAGDLTASVLFNSQNKKEVEV